MARRSEYGRYILSAGEIGNYTVCPEAWRLSAVEKVKTFQTQSSEKGVELHKSWARSYEDAIYFGRSVKALILLVLLAIVIYILGPG